jgi:hypothetical protein
VVVDAAVLESIEIFRPTEKVIVGLNINVAFSVALIENLL